MSDAAPAPRRVLVCGMGNVLEGDDGFGVRLAEALAGRSDLPPGVTVKEVGTGGIHLVQELMAGYEAVVVLDAVDRDAPPGTVFVLRPRVPELRELAGGFTADMHLTVPAKALVLASALGALPDEVYLVGCQPASLELGLELSGEAVAALERATREVLSLLERLAAGEPTDAPGAAGGGAADLATQDDILQVLYWLRGEGLARVATPEELTRWVGLEEAEIETLLEGMAGRGLVERTGPPGAGETAAAYALSEAGVREGGRRFADEFADITRPGHGECGDPECECMATGDPADCVHRAPPVS